jgi:hypothetical protein
VSRPLIPVPTVPGVYPRTYAGGEEFAEKQGTDRELAEQARAPAAPPPPAAKSADRRANRAGSSATREADGMAGRLDLSDYAARAQAQAGEVGEVFEYRLNAPVTIQRQRSAMIPILSAPFDGRRVSIFNRADSAEHPMRGVELKNTTGLQLMPGPISVFDGEAYAGDAQIGHIPAGDKRLVAYAVDLDVSTLVKDERQSTVQKIRITGGLLEQTTTERTQTGYAFNNKDAKRARTILVEHAKAPGWDLVEPKKPSEETQTAYRFELPLDASAKGTVTVVQERVDRQAVAITSIDLPTLMGYAKNGKVSQAVIDAVREAARRQDLVNQAQRRTQDLETERAAIGTDQTRIRENMKTVDKASDLYGRYVKKLGEQESRLEQISSQHDQAQQEMERLRAELEAYLRGLNVE